MVHYSPSPPQGYDNGRAFLISARPPHLQYGSPHQDEMPPLTPTDWVNGADSITNGSDNLVFFKGG